MIFKHTSKEPGMWRGWLENGQSVEISWNKQGWDFGGGVHIHSNDADQGDRMLFLKAWKLTVILPLGVIAREYVCGDEPQWSGYVSSEFGLTLHWRARRWSSDLPWFPVTLRYEQMLADGTWATVFDRDAKPYVEQHPYTYVLKSGEAQHRIATVSKRRHVLAYSAFKRIGWPRWIKESINIEFDGEVGERSGSWKGGCIGCGYDLQPDETIGAALRRMERERVFQ